MTGEMRDVAIIGAGPAGLQAAIHAVRKNASVVIIGQIERSSLYRAHVENYLCVDGISEGSALLKVGLDQALRFGSEHIAEDVLHIEQKDDFFVITVESGTTVSGRTLIFSTGTARKKLKVKGEKSLAGRGVSYCVDCDANFYRGVPVVVVGNESAAVDGALTLLKYASEVYLVVKELSVSGSLQQKLLDSNVHLIENAWPVEIVGENAVAGIMLDNGEKIEVEGVFIELGAKGALELATTLGVLLDSETFTHIDTDKKQRTNIAGIYAAGDIAGAPYQMAKAVGEGCVAGWEAANFALKQKRGARE